MDNVVSIGFKSLDKCPNLQKLHFPKMESIANNLFQYYGEFIDVKFDSVKEIGEYAFESCKKLKNIELINCEKISRVINYQNCYLLINGPFKILDW